MRDSKRSSLMAHRGSNKGEEKPLEESNQRMNFIISRIEDSKVRIAKSATKLYELME